MPLLILLFILSLPIIELSVLIDIGGEIGAVPTVALCLLTAAVGLSIARQQGIKTFQDMQRAARQGEPVGAGLVHGFFLAVAGVFLLIPGFLTDFFGALLLIPPVRIALGKAGMAHFVVHRGRGTHVHKTIIIDGEYHEESDGSDTATTIEVVTDDTESIKK